MVSILFFARYRELLGTSSINVEVSTNGLSLDSLKKQLIAERGQAWADVLQAENLVQAINQSIIQDDVIVYDGDEVAFFPPVTGG